MLGVRRRLQQLEESVSVLENEDDGDLYGAVSLRIIELELSEIQELLNKLQNAIKSHKQLSERTVKKVTHCTASHQTTAHQTTPNIITTCIFIEYTFSRMLCWCSYISFFMIIKLMPHHYILLLIISVSVFFNHMK